MTYARDSVIMLLHVLWTKSITTSCLVPQELLYEAGATQFQCLNTEKSEHTKVRLFLVIQTQAWPKVTNVNTILHFKSTLVFALQRAVSQIKADFESKLKFNTIYSSGTPSTQRVSTRLCLYLEGCCSWLCIHFFIPILWSFYHWS